MRRIKAVLFAFLVVGATIIGFSGRAAANQSPTQTYCMAWAALHNIVIAQWTTLLYSGIGCGLQPGDTNSDGAIYDPTLSPSGLTFTIPANVFIAKGARVVTQANPTSVPNNVTRYEWLDCNGCVGTSYGTWEATSTNTPPHSYSTLQYIVVSSGGSIGTFTPSYSSQLLASGWLNIAASNGIGWNQVVNAIGSTRAAQYYLVNTSAAGSIGSVPWFLTQANSTDCTSTGLGNAIQAWKNGDGPATTPFQIGCSTITTPTAIEYATITTGRALFNGPIIDQFLPTPGPSPSPSVEPICGAGINTGYENWCPNGLMLAMLFQSNTGTSATGTGTATFASLYDTALSAAACTGTDINFQLVSNTNCVKVVSIGGGWLSLSGTTSQPIITAPWTPAPMATSSSVPITNSSGSITASIPAWALEETNVNCVTGGTLSSDLIWSVQDKNGTNLISVDCNGDFIVNGTASHCAGFSAHVLSAGVNCVDAVGVGGGWLSASTISGTTTISTPWTPSPLATSSPIPWTNSGGGNTTTGLYNMQGTAAGCVFGGGGANNIAFAVEDNAATNLFRVMCSGNANVSRGLNTNSITITGLSSSTVGMLCGANATAASQCPSQVLTATTGNTSVATGAVGNTYQQLGSNISVTTGTTVSNTWLVTTVEHLSLAVGTAESFYGCITSASTFSAVDGDVDGAVGNCVTAKTNSIAGGPSFGATTTVATSLTGLSQTITSTVTVANSTTFTASCFVAGSTTTSISIFGYCHTTAVPQ